MFINSVWGSSNLPAKNYTFKGGPKPEILRNQLKVLLTQDIWAQNLKVKAPETALEKEVLLEILQNRLRLDRFARLSNQRFKLRTQSSHLNSLLKNNPNHPDIPRLTEELKKHGNLQSTLKTMDKNIEMEAKKNKAALDYFKEIENIENKYLEQKLLKISAMDKYYHQINKNNINKDEKLSTKELIDIISSDGAKNINKPAAVLSKKDLLLRLQNQYEQLLREKFDVYSRQTNHNNIAREARNFVRNNNSSLLKKFPNIEHQLNKIFETIEQKFTHKVDRLAGVDIYPIGDIWKDMRVMEATILAANIEIQELRAGLVKFPHSRKIKDALKKKENLVQKMKQEWLEGAKFSVKYEAINRERMNAAGRLSEYNYLTGENKIIQRHKEAIEIYKNNNNSIPDELWAKILI